MIGDMKENVIEWITGDDTVTATFTQQRFINRLRRMSETYGEAVKIQHENPDGSIVCKFPLKALHITIYNPNTGGFKKGEQSDDT